MDDSLSTKPIEVVTVIRRVNRHCSMNWFMVATTTLALAAATICTQTAFAIRHGVIGNTSISDPGWTKGAAAVFNNPARASFWVGPSPGYYTAEYRGDATALTAMLSDFATIEAKHRRLVVRDGVRSSFTPVDWIFNVWVPTSWERPTSSMVTRTFYRAPDQCPPPEMIVYTGGNVRWTEVDVPRDIDVQDERLEAHGFSLADGTVLEGRVVDLATQLPLVARIRTLAPSKGAGAVDVNHVAETVSDSQGRWVLKNVPTGCRQLILTADGYLPRTLYNPITDGQPGWHFFDRGLSRPGIVSGRALTNTGQPLANVEVRLKGDFFGPDWEYWRGSKFVTETDADGHFRFDQVPRGDAAIRVRHDDYCLPGAAHAVKSPTKDVALSLVKTAKVQVTVDFTGTLQPETYLVMIRPAEGGAKLPTWEQLQNHVTLVHHDSATDGLRVEIRPIDAKDQICFNELPPGKYILQGWPSRFGPGGQSTPFKDIERSKPLAIEVNSGQLVETRLPAK